MKEDEIANLGVAGKFNAFEPTRMSPTAAGGGQLLGRILGVVNYDIGTVSELAEIGVELGHTGFVIGGIHERAARHVEAVGQTSLRMMQPAGRNFRSVNFPFIAASHLVEDAGGAHHGGVNGEIRAGELRFENLFQTLGAEVIGLKAVKMKLILSFEKGMEEGDALDVIPVVVGDKDVCFETRVVFLGPAIAEHAQASAAIEDEASAARGGEFEARRISTIAPSVALECRRGAPHSPKDQFGSVVRHRWANRDAWPNGPSETR